MGPADPGGQRTRGDRQGQAKGAAWREAPEAGPWAVGTRVVHDHFGTGTVVGRKGSGDSLRVSVRFASGTKLLMVKYAPMRRAG